MRLRQSNSFTFTQLLISYYLNLLYTGFIYVPILEYVYCATDQCPTNCTCNWFSPVYVIGLTISCENRQNSAGLEECLHLEINTLLANRSELTSLRIQHAPLTRVPAGVCDLTSLASLVLDSNQLVALPDRCFSRMKGLKMISASNNSIGQLQVCCHCSLAVSHSLLSFASSIFTGVPCHCT